jgi:hypothetical protein
MEKPQYTPKGNRTPVFWMRTRCPGPLDDGGEHRTRADRIVAGAREGL